MFVNIIFMYLDASILGSCTFTIVITPPWIDLLINIHPSLSLIVFLALKYVLFGISIATEAFF